MTDNAAASQPTTSDLMSKLGIVITACEADIASGTMPVAGNTQSHGFLHGGATAALAETVASLAASAHAGPGRVALGGDLNITHHRAVAHGEVTATARAVHQGRTVATYEVHITDDQGNRIASARLSCHIRDALHT